MAAEEGFSLFGGNSIYFIKPSVLQKYLNVCLIGLQISGCVGSLVAGQ